MRPRKKRSAAILFWFSIKSSLAADQMRRVVKLNSFCCADNFAGTSCSPSCVPQPQRPFCLSLVKILPAVLSLRNTVNLRLPSQWRSFAAIQSHGQLQGARSPHSGIVGPLHSPFMGHASQHSSSPSPALRKTTAVYLIHLQHIPHHIMPMQSIEMLHHDKHSIRDIGALWFPSVSPGNIHIAV